LKKVLYIIPTFPCNSETFILREIEALKNHCVELHIYALRSKGHNLINKFDAADILYRQNIPFTSCIKTFFYLVCNKGTNTLNSFRYIISSLKNPYYCLKLLRNSFFLLHLYFYTLNSKTFRIHSHFADMATDLALVLHFLTGISYSFSVHARDLFVRPLNLKKKCCQASAVYACSNYAVTRLINMTGPKNVQLMYHGLNLKNQYWNLHYQNRMNKFKQFYFNLDVIKILAVGRYVPKKGYHILLNALQILKEEKISFQCKIIGCREQKNKLQKQILKNNLDEFVYLKDFMPFNSLLSEFAESHLFIHPSIIDQNGDQDNIPNVILEAQALGVPVIASNLPSIKEVLEHERTGFLFPAGDSSALANEIKRVINEFILMKAVIVNAKKQIEKKFDVSINTGKLINHWNTCNNYHKEMM
jgi:colanic acid/amylovoran biosynthesis glycosyltransferase